ncbi:MAG TPA: amidase [Kineosporiaceae bacterium]
MEAAEYRAYDALGLAELVARGEVSATELLDAARERTAAVNPRLNAVVTMLDREADEQVRGPLQGPFAGVPFLIKDLLQDYAGRPTSGGCRARAGTPATRHATVVRRWLDAGLVIFGKTNTPEFGAKGITEPDLFGPARNPWNPDRTPGGSSGGSAAAVAAGIVPMAGGNDGGGSIRIPAACCGLFGLKPGRGVVPAGPWATEHFHGAATDGVISRSVRDTAAMLDVLHRPDPSSAYHVAPPDGSYLEAISRPPGKLRIGVQVESSIGPGPSREARVAVEDAVRLLTDLGHDVVEASLGPDDKALAGDFLLPWFVHAALQVADASAGRAAGDGFELDTLVMAAIGRATPASAHAAALARWHDYGRILAEYHDRHDLLLTPTLARPPIRIGELDLPAQEARAARAVLALGLGRVLRRLGIVEKAVLRQLAWVPYTQLANVTGRPAMSVPLHWTADGLPLGVQFVGPPRGETTLLRLAAQLEQARPWAHRRPPQEATPPTHDHSGQP